MRVRRLLLAAVAVAVLVTGAWFARRDPSPSAAEQALGKVLPEVRFKRTPLDEALATLGRMAGTSIVLDRPTAEQAE